MCLRFLFCVLTCYCTVYAQKNPLSGPWHHANLDSLQHAYRASENDTVRLRNLMAITDAYSDHSDFQNVLLYNDLKLKLSRRLKTSEDSLRVLAGTRGEASYYSSLGMVLKKQGNSKQALSNLLRALSLSASIHDERQIAVLLSLIASTHSQIGNYNESLRYSFQALKQKQKLNSPDLAATELNNIGAIYCDTRHFSKALFYFMQARDISRTRGDKISTALYTGNIGHAYQLMCDSAFEAGDSLLSYQLQDKAIGYYFASLQASEELGDIENASVCLENIGIIYSNIFQYQKAMPYLQRALAIYEELGLKAEQSYCQIMLGEAYRGLGQNAKAQLSYTKALELARQTHSTYYLMEAYLGNSEFYEKTGRPAEALRYYKDYIRHRDSIFNTEKTRAMAHTELNYEFEKKEAALKYENDRIAYEAASNRKLHEQWRLFAIIVICLGAVILVFGKRAYDNKKKLATMLAHEDERKNVLLQEVHHRINNNLQIISSLLTLQADDADNKLLSEYLQQSQNRIQSLSAMHELLYDTSSQLEINMRDYLHRVLDFHREVAAALPVPVKIEESVEQLQLPAGLAVPVALIVNELITNSLKYAFAGRENGRIRVELRKNPHSQSCTVSVADNGGGLPEQSERRENSLGLRLVSILTRQIRGKFLSKNEEGASFSVIFDTER